jgi:hypothetical protein
VASSVTARLAGGDVFEVATAGKPDCYSAIPGVIVPTLCVGMHQDADAERRGRRYHAERGNDQRLRQTVGPVEAVASSVAARLAGGDVFKVATAGKPDCYSASSSE